MSEPSHDEIRRLFELVLDAPPNQRAPALDRECVGDEGLKGRILAMIAAAEDDRFLGDATADVGDASGAPAQDATVVATPREQPGQMIDRYKLLQQIGEGGFGVVYMAEQREPVTRKVALKIIKLGMDTKQVIARFEAERQALAMMDHPNIARIFDAGATSGGRPYFVMELVKGEPITEYCDRHNLDVTARLALFQQVCHAVQHAHQKGIIHRDIKPGNVLITLHDGKPVPKVIDFGIAKATNARLTEKTVFTEYRQFIGTPEYMSPEQAEMSGLDIDTRSDVYSLGVLLYELLTGTTPFDAKKLRSAGYGEIQRIIREETPPKPSTRLSQSVDTLPGVAAHRHIEPRKLSVLVRGDLDWIVMKAMEKDRQRRYETTNGLALDIQRYLDNEPVTASPPSASYKLKKLIKRNKGAFSAAAIVFLVLTLGVVGTTWGMISTRAEFERAERELTRATEVKRLITDMFSSIDPDRARGQDITLLRGILDNTADRLSRGKIQDELIAADMHQLVGRVYKAIGLFDEANRHVPQALAIRTRLLGEQHEDTLVSMSDMAGLHGAQGHFAKAEALYARALQIMERFLGEEHPDTLRNRTNLAHTLLAQSEHEEAGSMLENTVKVMQRVLGDKDIDTLKAMLTLASVYYAQGRYSDAEDLYTRALELQREVLGPNHTTTVATMSTLASLYTTIGRYDQAESLLRQVIDIQRTVIGEAHPSALVVMLRLAQTYREQSRFGDAEALLLELLNDFKDVLSDAHPLTLACTGELATLYVAQGRYAEAVPFYQQALAIQNDQLGEEHTDTLATMLGLALAYTYLGDYEEAEPLSLRVLDIYQERWGERDPNTLRAMTNTGMMYSRMNRYEESRAYLERSLSLKRVVLGDDNVDTLRAMHNLASVHWHQDNYLRAETMYLEVIDRRTQQFGEKSMDRLGAMQNLARLYIEVGRHEDAREQFELCVPTMRDVLTVRHPWTRMAMRGLADTYIALKQPEHARPLFRELLEYEIATAEAANAPAATLNRVAWTLLINELDELRDPAKALEFAQRACDLEEANAGAGLWTYLDTLALAQHLTGDTTSAIETQKRAIALMPVENADPAMHERLAGYEAARSATNAEADGNEGQ